MPSALAGLSAYDFLPQEPHSSHRSPSSYPTLHTNNGVMPWLEPIMSMTWDLPIDLLSAEITQLDGFLESHMDELIMRQLLRRAITKRIETWFEGAEVHGFGSVEMGMFAPDADMDLVVLFNVTQFAKDHAEGNNVFLASLAYALEASRMAYQDKVQHIYWASTPVVKFVTQFGRFNVDITVNQRHGLQAAQLVRQYQALLPTVRPLVMLVKMFTRQERLNESYTGGLSGYLTIILVVHFLISHPHIRDGFYTPGQNIGGLALDFFRKWGSRHDYMDVGITLKDGGSTFAPSSKSRSLLGGRGIFVDDPVNPGHNVGASAYNIYQVYDYFMAAHEALMNGLTAVENRIQAHNTSVRGRDIVGEGILSRVVRIPQKLIEFREATRARYDSGLLQDFLNRE